MWRADTPTRLPLFFRREGRVIQSTLRNTAIALDENSHQGWGDGSFGKVLAAQELGPEFNPGKPHPKAKCGSLRL